MSDSLNIVDKAFISAKANMNASCLTREGDKVDVSNAAVDISQIRTLAEYYRANSGSLKEFDPSKLDNKNLMNTFVIPLTLDNGEQIDLIINNCGQDMACIYHDANSQETAFQLTPRMEAEIDCNLRKNGITGLQTKLDLNTISKMIKPSDLEEFIDAVENDNLVPQNPRDTIARVKSKDENADVQLENDEIFEVEDKQNKTPSEVQEEISQEEQRLEKIAQKAGMTLEDIKKYCKTHKLTSKTIKGAIEIRNVDGFEEMLGIPNLNRSSDSSVVVIRTEEENMQTKARVVGKDGKTLLDKPQHYEALAKLVPEQPTSEPIADIDGYVKTTMELQSDVEYTAGGGTSKTAVVEGNKDNIAEFEMKFRELEETFKVNVKSIEESDLPPDEKAKQKKNLAKQFYSDVSATAIETGVDATVILRDISDETEVITPTESRESDEDGLSGVIKATGVEMFGDDGKEHEILTPAELAARRRGLI